MAIVVNYNKLDNDKYEQYIYRFENQSYSIETLELNEEQNIERMTFREYCRRMVDKLNEEANDKIFIIVERQYNNSTNLSIFKRRAK